MFVLAFLISSSVTGQELTRQTWPVGTLISQFDDGGRMATYHRGYLYLGALHRTTVWDIRNPANPVRVRAWDVGANGHLWWKMGDLFSRHYSNPVIGSANSEFADLSNFPDIVPWSADAPLPQKGVFADFRYWPHFIRHWDGYAIQDLRTGETLGRYDFPANRGVNAKVPLRIGNLLFYVPNPDTTGVAVFDIGDPTNVRLLDVLEGNFRNYTTWYGVWRHHVVLATGDDTNFGGNNLVVIDFSDPTNLRYTFGLPTSEVTQGRYIYFQDEYGYMGKGKRLVRVNMETQQAEDLPIDLPVGNQIRDYQIFPLGHLLMSTGSFEGNDDFTAIHSLSNQLDTRPPTVGYALPVDGATNQPTTTVMALIINEVLDDTTVVPANILVRPVRNGVASGAGLPIDVVNSLHDVVTVATKSRLEPNTTYEIRVTGGGIRDVAGNGIDEYVSYFSTGSSIDPVSGSELPPPPDLPPEPEPTDITAVAPTINSIDTGSSALVDGQQISMQADVSHPDGTVEYRWRFGDGTPTTDWGPSNSASHAYQQPGQYSVFLQTRVTNNDGETFTASEVHRLVVASADPVPAEESHSSPIVVDEAARRVWAVNPDSDTVAVLNADSLQKIREIAVPRRPVSVAVDFSNRAWVTAQDSDEIYVVRRDGGTDRKISLNRGARPSGIVMSADGRTAYVAEYASGFVRRFDVASYQETGSVYVGTTAQALALTAAGTLHVTRFIAQSDEGAEIVSVDTSRMVSAGTILLPADRTTLDTGAAARGVPNYVRSLALSANDDSLWYVGKKDNVFRGLVRDGTDLQTESMIRVLIGNVDLINSQEAIGKRIDIDDASIPSAITLSPSAAHILVTLQGNNRVIAIDAATGEEVASAEVGLAPQGIAIDTATHRVFVQNLTDRSVTVLEGEALLTRAQPVLPLVTTIGTVDNELFTQAELRGKQVFYNADDLRMSIDQYISCASCHDNGGHDGRIWDFTGGGEGLRMTISMRGRGGMEHGRVHWTANFDEIQDFEIPIRNVFGGSGFIDDADFSEDSLGAPNAGHSPDLDALASYVASLTESAPSPYRNNDGSLTPEADRGRGIFARQECGSCHSGTKFTDSPSGALHDVGTKRGTSGSRLGTTLAGFDTPTLIGLWEKNRFLHDGRATTVMGVLQDASAASHGDMDTLSSRELEDLEQYLLSIEGAESAPVSTSAPDAPVGLSVR